MEICVAGWYFEKALFPVLAGVADAHPTWFLCDSRRVENQRLAFAETVIKSGIRYCVQPFAGLEWAKYDHFIKNIWRGGAVLFMHDDIRIGDPAFFDAVAATDADQAYLFQDEAKGGQNQHFHGRGIFCSAKFIRLMLDFGCDCAQAEDHADHHHNIGTVLRGTGPHRGFWYDPWNVDHASGKPPAGIRHYNDGIYHFAAFAKRAASGTLPGVGEKYASDRKLYFPQFEHARRGRF